MKHDVVALGEILIDFTHNGASGQGNPMFEANPGGAPCNFLAMLARLGRKIAFIGKVGNDMFGDLLEKAVREVGIDAAHLMRDASVNTTLAFVHTAENGDRDFSFYRKPGADMMIGADEIPADLIENARVFHYGSLSMTADRCFEATKRAVSIAENAHILRSYDPNLRPLLWDDENTARERIRWGLGHCDILKLADNEIEWLTGTNDYEAAGRMLLDEFDIPLMLVSLGAEGSMAFYGGRTVFAPALRTAATIETTGAGDCFFACCADYVLENGLAGLTDADLTKMLSFANRAAAYVTTRRGALRVMPDRKTAEAFRP